MTLPFELVPPDGRTWEIDPVHQPRPWTCFMAELYAEPFGRGFAAGCADHGLLLERREFHALHGFGYLASRLVPAGEIDARLAILETVFDTRPWRDSLRIWDSEVKPRAIEANRALQAIDPAELSMPALRDHIARCREHLIEMVYQHMRFTIAALLPVGDFIARASSWTGASAADLLALLRGASPISCGSPELERLVEGVRCSSRSPASLEALLAEPGEVGAAARAWLDLVGNRPVDGLDVGNDTMRELPELLLRTLRAAVDARATPRPLPVVDVPAARRRDFDEALAEARLVYRLRDERGVYTDVWAAGIVRRALLAAGDRLASAGQLSRPELLVDASWTEIQALLAGACGPNERELADRAEFRRRFSAADAPPYLGPAPHPPPLDDLPPFARRAFVAIAAALGALFGDSDRAHDDNLLRGLPASSGSYSGTARVIERVGELGRLQAGDVLVAITTSEAFNVALPLLGAIVTDRGGSLSHAAIVARELGIPAVVGTREATRRIRDGARIHVDGTTGEVRMG